MSTAEVCAYCEGPWPCPSGHASSKMMEVRMPDSKGVEQRGGEKSADWVTPDNADPGEPDLGKAADSGVRFLPEAADDLDNGGTEK